MGPGTLVVTTLLVLLLLSPSSGPAATGRKPDVRACAWCHLPNGVGHPRSANLTGLPADYMAQQLADFKSGARHLSVGGLDHGGARSGKTTELMKPVAAQLTLQQMIDAAAYLGSRMP